MAAIRIKNARVTQRKRRRIRLHRGTAHPTSQIGVDGQIEELDEETPVERDALEVDGLGGIIDCGFPGFGISYAGGEKWVLVSQCTPVC